MYSVTRSGRSNSLFINKYIIFTTAKCSDHTRPSGSIDVTSEAEFSALNKYFK